MRGAFPPCRCYSEHERLGKGVTRTPKLVMALIIILMPTTLYAQSEKKSGFTSPEFTSSSDSLQSYHSGAGDLLFSSDLGPTSAAGEGSRIAPANPPPSDSQMNLGGVSIDTRKYASSGSEQLNSTPQAQQGVRGTESDSPDGSVKAPGLIPEVQKPSDRNLDIYYRNRREFSLDVGWHP